MSGIISWIVSAKGESQLSFWFSPRGGRPSDFSISSALEHLVHCILHDAEFWPAVDDNRNLRGDPGATEPGDAGYAAARFHHDSDRRLAALRYRSQHSLSPAGSGAMEVLGLYQGGAGGGRLSGGPQLPAYGQKGRRSAPDPYLRIPSQRSTVWNEPRRNS